MSEAKTRLYRSGMEVAEHATSPLAFVWTCCRYRAVFQRALRDLTD